MKLSSFKDEYFRNTGLMFIGISLFNLFNLLYHFFMVRNLPPVDYGHLNTLMAVFMLITVPANTVQTTVTKFVSSFHAKRRYDLVRSLLKYLLFLTSMVALAIFLIIFLGSGPLASFLKISPRGLIILLGALLFFAMVIPVPWGGLQGLQKFGSLTLNLIINGVLKLLLGICFIVLGLGVLGAVSAIVLSYGATIFLSLLMLKMSLPKVGPWVDGDRNSQNSNPSYVSEMYRYFLPTGITLLCFMVLTNIDLILVKHFFKPIEAGYYSIAQMVGKIILFFAHPSGDGHVS